MKKTIVRILTGVVLGCLLLVAVFTVIVHRETAELNKSAMLERTYLLSDEQMAAGQLDFRDNIVATSEFSEGLLIEADETVTISLSVPASGSYHLIAEYSAPDKNLFDNPIDFVVGDVSFTAELSFLWADDISSLVTDRYGNEVLPDQYQLPYAVSFLEDYRSFSGVPIQFEIPKGDIQISMHPQNQALKLYGLYVVNILEEPSYSTYRKTIGNVSVYDGPVRIIEGEDYRAKNDSSIRGTNMTNSSLTPYNPYVKLINVTADESNKKIGQKLYYEIEVPKDGLYYLSIAYSQPKKTGGYAYRTIEIDGKVPYAELRDVSFAYTGINSYNIKTVETGVYLTKGIHTIGFKVTAGLMDEPYRELMSIIDEINDTGIELKRIKGNNSNDAAGIDGNRTWDILQYVPDLLTKIEGWRTRLLRIYQTMEDIGGMKPAYVSDLMLAAQNLERLADNPRELPNRLSLLSDDSSSAAQLASLTLTKIEEQNLSIDRIFLHGPEAQLPSGKESLLSKITTSLKQFLFSFSDTMNETIDVNNGEETLTVWINKPAQYVETLRQLTEERFTAAYGIPVTFSIMPDEKKITLANSTGNNPDVALGLSYYRPAEFAMRGMAVNLLEFEDFLDWYGEEYNVQALSPMAYEDGIYGASETQDFFALFYRTDILEALNLEVPDTWEDVKAMMPVLHRSAMNFNLPLANNVGYKSFEATGGFIFQNGGNYYSDDGFSSNFGNTETIAGLREMIDLYQVYGLAQNIPNFFNAFRSGSVPIGVSNFSTYLQLQIGAPELNGRWDIALVPGTRQDDGTICRYWSADASSAMIFSNTPRKEQAYCFLKWWLSSETQLSYANNLQMKYGPDYVWNTANHVAFAGMPYPLAHKKTILEQWSWQKEALRHPASYILEREVSNAWIAIVTEGKPFQARIDEATLASNREIRRKLTEFGYLNHEGEKQKDYNIHLIDDIIEARREEHRP